MVTIKVFGSRQEAEIVRGLLESYEIPSYVQADDQGGMRPYLAASLGVELKVQPEDVEEALEILKAVESAQR